MAYEINYNDPRFQQVEKEKQQALTEIEQTYADMALKADEHYQAQINAAKDYADTQTKNQQEKTDFAIEQIEQQKTQSTKDYMREQSGAYVDWQKQSNQYGVNAEQLASQGLLHSGYAESSQVSMYNTYQNRVATARESYNIAILNYNNAIKDARLQNNTVLAEIAYQALQTQLELSLQGFQYKNQLLLEKLTKKTEASDRYYLRYQDVLGQINTENKLQEEVRQYNASYKLEQEQLKQQKAIADAQLKQEKEIADAKLKEEQRQFNATLALQTANVTSSSSRSSSSKSSSSKSSSSAVPVSSGVVSAKATGSSGGTSSGKASGGTPSFSSYEQAASYLQSKGISGDGGLMTKNEWRRRKSAGSTSAETQYSSYEEYLNNFVKWKLDSFSGTSGKF